MTESPLATTRFESGTAWGRLRLLAFGVSVGVVSGMGSFMSVQHTYIPWGLSQTWAYAVMGLAGVYAHVLARDLSESITVAIVASVVGLGFHMGTWVSPLWILSYPPVARDLLLPTMLGRALAGNVLVYFVTFYGSYFGAVVFAGYLDP